MKLLVSDVELWKQKPGIDGVFSQIERVGRICYKSEHLIKPGSAKPFVERLMKSGHGKCLEHGSVYLCMESGYEKYQSNPYSKVNIVNGVAYISTNYRVIVENSWVDDLDNYWYGLSKYHIPRITAHFICDRGVSAEANRHTVNSAMEQSTRYCNYGSSKFGGGISVIKPADINLLDCNFYDISEDVVKLRRMCGAIWGTDAIDHENLYRTLNNWNEVDFWLFANLACEFSYLGLLEIGWKPQQARRVLPLDLKTELCHTAFLDDWGNFIRQRSASDAHPDIKILSDKLKVLLDEFSS